MIQEEANSSGSSATTSNTKAEATATPNGTPSEESNSLLQSINAIKTYNPKIAYVTDNYVDAYDSNFTWRVAKILQVKGEIATVNFDGWSNKWNEVEELIIYIFNLTLQELKIGGTNIAPFKRVTSPYTGGTKGAVREFSFEDSKPTIIAVGNFQIEFFS